MRAPQGYLIAAGPAGVALEADTITCAHCNGVHVVTKADSGGFCRQCMKALCTRCADRGTCTPFERQLEAWERRERLMLALE